MYAEVFGHGEVRMPAGREHEDQMDRWFRQDLLFMAEVDDQIVEEARVLANDHGLRGADAIHMATALLVGCDTFFTWDNDFPIGKTIGNKPRVANPHPWGQGQLGDLP